MYDEERIGGAMHFNMRKCCVSLYDDVMDWEGEHKEEEVFCITIWWCDELRGRAWRRWNCNVMLRKAIAVQK